VAAGRLDWRTPRGILERADPANEPALFRNGANAHHGYFSDPIRRVGDLLFLAKLAVPAGFRGGKAR